MSDTWDKIVRQVVHRANLISSDTASAADTNYNVTNIGATQMGDRAIEFPDDAVYDAILNTSDILVGLIGADPYSPYRIYFPANYAAIPSGNYIPAADTDGKARVGVIGTVRDSATFKKMKAKEYEEVMGVSRIAGLKQSLLWYYTDNVRLWTTTAAAIPDAVVWDKATERASLTSSPMGNCPFPEELHETLVCGALSFLFRSSFNIEQAPIWRQYFNDSLQRIAPGLQQQAIEQRKLLE